jgi:hypothetical protein
VTKKATSQLKLSRGTVRELTGTELRAAGGGVDTRQVGSTKRPSVDVLHACTSYFPSCICAPTAIC